ncbi:hypothetical protein CVT26_015180 [Gymnopilus dilepis]|uniref:Uncharacterized protein n=1 Tax=Gymnopilus dilepis TaxID=231916 RepID=A0A409WQS8_9AGAR|nr:hypothetical protein CVT26_015180 [Gymnopilus dilepis]
MPPNPVVAFGSSEHSFYIGCGLQYFAIGMPQSLLGTISKLPAIKLSWLATDAQAQGWVAYDSHEKTFHFDPTIPKELLEKLKGQAEYVTLGPSKDRYFVKLPATAWTANLPDEAVKDHQELRARLGPNFDTTLIYGLSVGFLPLLDDDAKGGKLEQVLKEKEDDWLIERGSSLCQWNANYFYLMFKHIPTGRVQIVWELPEQMNTKLWELRKYADTPKGRQEIDAYQAMELMAVHQRFVSRKFAVPESERAQLIVRFSTGNANGGESVHGPSYDDGMAKFENLVVERIGNSQGECI